MAVPACYKSQVNKKVTSFKLRCKLLTHKLLAGGGARIDEELRLIVVPREAVRVPRHEDVAVQLPLHRAQALHIAPRHHLPRIDQLLV